MNGGKTEEKISNPFQNPLLEMLNKWYFVSKIVLTYCEKKCSSDREKTFKI